MQRNSLSKPPDGPKPMGCSKSSSKRKAYSNTILPQETRPPKAHFPLPGIHPEVPSSCLLHGSYGQCFFLPQG